MLFIVSFYYFFFSRYFDLTKHHFLSDILVQFPDSSNLHSPEEWTISRWIEYQPKSYERYIPFLHCISSFEGTCKIQPPDLLLVNKKFNPIPGKFFQTFERQGGLFGPCLKNCYKSCLLHSNYLKLGTTYLWTLTKILTLVT